MENSTRFEKFDDTTLRVFKSVPVMIDYKLDVLLAQKKKIEEKFSSDIAEIDELILNCNKLGVNSDSEIIADAS